MSDDRVGVGLLGRRRDLPTRYQALVVLPFAYGVCVAVLGAAWMLFEPGQSLPFYSVNVAVALAPGLAYVAAALLFLTDSRWRAAWLVLLVCGVALLLMPMASVFQLGLEGASYLDYIGFVLFQPRLLPLYLTVLSAIEFHRSRARQSTQRPDQRTEDDRSRAQL